jgi:hypothetical protein
MICNMKNVVKEDNSINVIPNQTPLDLEKEKILDELIYDFMYAKNKHAFIRILKEKKGTFIDYVSLATWYNWEDAVQHLIDNFNVNEYDINDAFQIAVTEKYKNITNILIKHPKFIPSYYNNLHLFSAICSNYSDIIEQILNHPKTVYYNDYKFSFLDPFKQCLNWCIINDRLDLIKILNNKYNVELTYSDNLPLRTAQYYEQTEIINFLKEFNDIDEPKN